MVDYQKLAEAIGVELHDEFVIVLNEGNEWRTHFRLLPDGIQISRTNIGRKWFYIPKPEPKYNNGPLEWGYRFVGEEFALVLVLPHCLRFDTIYSPVNGQKYWSYSGNDWSVTEYTWTGSMEDIFRKNMKAVFDKPYKASRNRPYIYKETTGEEWTNG